MAYVKHAMMASEECICIASEQMKEAIQYLEEIGFVHKAGRLKEAMRLIEFDMWNDNRIEIIKEVRSIVRTARHGSNSYFSVRVYVEMFNGECRNFTIGSTYGNGRSTFVQHIKEVLKDKMNCDIPTYHSDIPFPFELEIQTVKYKELDKEVTS